MKIKFDKKIFSFSNIIFVIAVILLLYPTSREWFMRQLAFAPSVNNVENAEKISSYQWELRGLNTENIKFSQFENKLVFVNFWATWCPPCRAELPMIQELYNDYKDKVAFVFVTDESWATVQQFFDKYNYKLPTYNSVSLPPQTFLETNSIPASYLIDTNGNILISKTGAANWSGDKVRDLLDNLIKEQNLQD